MQVLADELRWYRSVHYLKGVNYSCVVYTGEHVEVGEYVFSFLRQPFFLEMPFDRVIHFFSLQVLAAEFRWYRSVHCIKDVNYIFVVYTGEHVEGGEQGHFFFRNQRFYEMPFDMVFHFFSAQVLAGGCAWYGSIHFLA